MIGIVIFNIILCIIFYAAGRAYNRKYMYVDFVLYIIFIWFLILGNYSIIEQIKNENAQEIIEDYQNGKFDCETTVVKVNNEIVSIKKKYYYKK